MTAQPEGSRVVIAGGTGYVGRALVSALRNAHHEIVVLTRSQIEKTTLRGIRHVRWNPVEPGDWGRALEGAEAIINLSGSPIAVRWTAKNKDEILKSRLAPTQAIGRAIARCEKPPKLWINASAIGFYGETGSREVSEASRKGEGFLPDVCARWEQAVDEQSTPETRKVKLRFGHVLGRGSAFLGPLDSIVKKFLGGAAGSGNQHISWIHITDLARIVTWTFDNEIEGPVNAVAPKAVTNSSFMAEMRRILHRPWSPPVPFGILKLGSFLMGVEPELIEIGTRVAPQALLARDFEFRYCDVRSALKNIYHGH